MLSYRKKNTLAVRRSGLSIFSNELTKVTPAQRLAGCCCCYKREVFDEFSFDTNLKRWSYMEDLDFSYRLHKKYPRSLWAIPNSKIIHKTSNKARLPKKLSIYMTIMYWFYIFFKDVFEDSIKNLLAFIWAILGNVSITIATLIVKRKIKHEWWTLINILSGYAMAFKNLRNIRKGNLEFFNKNMQK
jgi:GT2 family glycosyltransferase